jgi:VanZ family protein
VFVGYVGVIYATLSIVRTLQRFLQRVLGETGFAVVLTGVLVLTGAWLVMRVLRRLKGVTPRLMVAGVVLAYAYFLVSLEVAVERVHFLQYGLLTYLGYRLLRHERTDASVFPACLVLCALVGMGDEGIQWVLPRRVGEVRDVWINIVASLLGLVLLVAVRPPELRLRPTRRSWATLGPWFGVLLLSGALFLRYVHGFGHLVEDPVGGSFRSVYTRDQLLESAPWKARALRQLGGEFPDERPRGLVAVLRRKAFERSLKTPTHAAYLHEAYRHLGARDGLASDKAMSWQEAIAEHVILKRYYRSYYDLQPGASWTATKERRIRRLAEAEAAASPTPFTYRSRVQQLLVTSFSERTMWRVVVPLSLALLSAPLAVRARGHGTRGGIERRD